MLWDTVLQFIFVFISHLQYCQTSWSLLWRVWDRINCTGLNLLPCRTTTVKWRMEASSDLLSVCPYNAILMEVKKILTLLSTALNQVVCKSRNSTLWQERALFRMVISMMWVGITFLYRIITCWTLWKLCRLPPCSLFTVPTVIIWPSGSTTWKPVLWPRTDEM